MTRKPLREVRLGAISPGVNSTTVWSDHRAGSQIDFSSFVHLAKTAESAKFDFFFLAEGLRVREKNGLIYDLDVVGRPDTLPILAALAAVTENIGLIGTINATFNEPYEVARQFATLDHLTAGRAGWNVVTSSDAFTGANFRRGGFLPYEERYERAAEMLEVARALWDSWPDDAIVADGADGRFWSRPDIGSFAHSGKHFDVQGQFSVPASPQGYPVILQAGDAEAGRDFGGSYADGIFTMVRNLDDARKYYREVKARKVAIGGAPDDLLILPGATFALGDTTEEAHQNAAVIRRQQVSGATAIGYIEEVWNRDLSAYDPDGPLPAIEPALDADSIIQGKTRLTRDPVALIDEWRHLAETKNLSIRDLVVEVSAKQDFIGTPAEVAEQINHRVQTEAADGFILIPHLTPTGLDEFAAKVVPELQERGVFRTEYTGTTLRENLGLPAAPQRPWPSDHLSTQFPTTA
ncbi:NtaA/DmoA family FMN-dependent monooxygenase [Gordonia sp. KTR9]|uniref:NtaA/DmoA family FMN-dependent monooxygenase n=1 Tax=Gordonia sp. KTR9 TaxID=337191 RepID=UPI00027DDE1B|nr:NtaA/DmoA family FMN-dependent monooxygenase [Gordonia sp. KTR9]AFR47277.1 Coenzyme F420-dependent N5,N10-methylene tetrahydromethanopterin reductase-related flavin- dependent oxidoreductase [Gordonia sp. KTR9]